MLPLIIFSQFAGTSLWFATNAILPELQKSASIGPEALGLATSSVQLGFIIGTLLFALLTLADRFPPSLVFVASAVAGAVANMGVYWYGTGLWPVLCFRFATGFFLAGIYPVGMKIAADWYGKGLGKALGYLVGALVLGTAFPHMLKTFALGWPWRYILAATSGIAILGGVLLAIAVGDGPHRKASPPFSWGAIPKIFSYRAFRAAAFGYFGHMWELYAFWALVPALVESYWGAHPSSLPTQTSLWAGLAIGVGALGCVGGGYASVVKGSAKVAFAMLAISGLCCLLSPVAFSAPPALFIPFLVIWGFSVVGDSPQFSAIVAQNAPPQYVGTALTIVNSIGFAITIASIQWASHLLGGVGARYVFLLLAVGPLAGLVAIYPMASGRHNRKSAATLDQT